MSSVEPGDRQPRGSTASLTATAAHGTTVTVGAQVIRLGLQFIGIVVLARLLVPEDFALVAMVMAVIGVADVLRDAGLSTAAVRSETLSDGERTNLFWANTALGGLCTLAALAATPLLVALYGEPRLADIVPALAGIFVLSGVNTQYRVSLARQLRFGALAGADIVSQTLALAVAIVLAAMGAGYWALVAQLVVAGLLVLVVNAVNCRWLPGLPQRAVSIRRFFRFGARVLGSAALNYGVIRVDEVIVGATVGAHSLGLYNRASQLATTPVEKVNVPLSRVALPVLSRAQADDARFVRAAGRAHLVGSYVTPLILVLAAGTAGPLVELMLGDRWLAAAPILAVLAVAAAFRSVAHVAYWLFLARGRPGDQLRLDLWAKPAMILVISAGIPWGVMGVASAVAVAWAGYLVVSFAAVSRAVRVPRRQLYSRAVHGLLVTALPVGLAARGASMLVDGPLLALACGFGAGAAALGVVVLAVPAVRTDITALVVLVKNVLLRRSVGT